MFKMTNKTYDILKFIAQILLPALAPCTLHLRVYGGFLTESRLSAQ